MKESPISYQQLKSLLFKNESLEVSNEKWYRYLDKGEIVVKQESYKLSINSTKREIIYNENGQMVDTKPIVINEID